MCQAGGCHQPGFIIRVLMPSPRQSGKGPSETKRGLRGHPDTQSPPQTSHNRRSEARTGVVYPTACFSLSFPLPLHSPATLKAPALCQAYAEHSMDQTQVLPLSGRRSPCCLNSQKEAGPQTVGTGCSLCWTPFPHQNPTWQGVSSPGEGQSGHRHSQAGQDRAGVREGRGPGSPDGIRAFSEKLQVHLQLLVTFL